VWEGEAPPEATPGSSEAIRCWNFLNNGMGGIDWKGLELAVEFYGVKDVEGLIRRMLIVKGHKKPGDDTTAEGE
jgi:hypothetical protein